MQHSAATIVSAITVPHNHTTRRAYNQHPRITHTHDMPFRYLMCIGARRGDRRWLAHRPGERDRPESGRHRRAGEDRPAASEVRRRRATSNALIITIVPLLMRASSVRLDLHRHICPLKQRSRPRLRLLAS